MARPNLTSEKRRELLPVLASAFAQLGYRRATTAALAERCGVQENILYRLWPDKKAMFLAAIEFTYEFSEQTWLRMLAERGGDGGGNSGGSAAERLLRFEADHHGEFGHFRVTFMALSECDDPDVRETLSRMYRRFHRFLAAQIAAHRGAASTGLLDAELVTWAAIGLGTMASIGRELELLAPDNRKRLLADVGRHLLDARIE